MKEKHYTALVDADTILHSSSIVIQDNDIEVLHKASGRTKMFKNITTFREWLKTDSKGVKFIEDDFSWEKKPELNSDVSHAMHTIKLKIEAIQNLPWCKDVKLFIGGEGNFRKQLDPEYKANRGEKPIAFQECKDYMIKKWKGKVEICDGWEAEDHASAEAYAGYKKALKSRDKDDCDVVLCHVDGDLDMIPGWHFNYQKPELGIWWVDSVTGYKAFATQLLVGDRGTDNVKGVDFVTPEMKKEFGIKTKSIGEASAAKILEGLNTEKALLEKVVSVYKMAYGDCWKDMLDFTGKLVWITREHKQAFDADAELKRLKIK